MEERISVLELPRGVWRWISDNTRDLARIAGALEKMVEELAEIRQALQEDRKGDNQ